MDDGNSVFADLVEFVIGIFMGLVPLDIVWTLCLIIFFS